MSNIQTSPLPRAPETPLQGAVMLSLVASATAITILFYGFCLFALALIGVLLLLDIALLIALARFGMHEYMIEPIRDQTRLAGFIFQSLNLGHAPDEGLPLSREEAPRLWAMVTAMAQRVGVPVPDVLLLQMDANAWVQLRGYRKGRGSCTLGVGFDLLAIFTRAEMEAVIAHEMAHARLIQRGYRGWLSNGITRIGRLAYMLGYAIAHARDNNKRFWTARFLYRGSELLGKTGSRLVAAYSRQDEFAADRVAAELCGAALYRQALLKVHVAGEAESEVQMDARARLLQLQREGSYSQWVRDLRLPATPQKYNEVQQKVLSQDTRDEFDTHPILSDRLAALPPTRSTSDGANEAPALQLLDDADAVAARLLAAWEWRVDEEERKESEHLRRWIRKKARATYRTPGQYLGLTILVCGVLALLIALVLLTDNTIAISQKVLWLVLSLAAIGGGWWLIRLWRWQEKSSLPVPSFAAWRETSTSEARQTNPNQWMDSLQSELRAENPLSLQKRSDAATYWGEESYRALQACDYRRALACSTLSLEARSQNLNGLLSGGVAAAYFGAGDAAQEMLGAALQRHGLGPSVSWALGWGLTLLGQYDTAEPYLLDAAERRPQEAGIWSLLALAQWQQDKLREANHSVQRAEELEPHEIEHRVLRMRILADAGRAKDALAELATLEAERSEAFEVMLAGVRLHLLLGHDDEAATRQEQLLAAHAKPETSLQLGYVLAESNRDAPARSAFEAASEAGFYPDALVQLARLDFRSKDFDAMKAHLLAALDLTREPLAEASNPFGVLDGVLQGLAINREPQEKVLVWLVQIELQDTMLGERIRQLALADNSLVPDTFALWTVAATREEAEALVREIYEALVPGAPWPADKVKTEEDRAERPTGPAVPGVHRFGFGHAAS